MSKANVEKLSILVVDPLAGERDHLIDDDLFLCKCLKPLAGKITITSSESSIKNIQKQMNVEAVPFGEYKWLRRFPRLQLICKMMQLHCTKYTDIIFPSFEEVSTLLFMLIHPNKRVHLIFHNNISPERIQRHPVLWTFFMKLIVKKAVSLLVPSRYQADKIMELDPQLDRSRIIFRPLNQMGELRYRPPLLKRKPIIFFMGSPLESKPTKPIIDLIKRDREKKYRYVLHRMDYLDNETRTFLLSQSNVDYEIGYVTPDRYYHYISEARWVILTHNNLFEGKLSGIFCDAVASGTPVIARDMAPHNEFFERFGDMGYLVDYSDPDWCNKFLAIDFSVDFEIYEHNMAVCRSTCSIEAIRDVFQLVFYRK